LRDLLRKEQIFLPSNVMGIHVHILALEGALVHALAHVVMGVPALVRAVAVDARELAAVPARVLVAVDARDIINSLV
jgi:hypothetical protein